MIEEHRLLEFLWHASIWLGLGLGVAAAVIALRSAKRHKDLEQECGLFFCPHPQECHQHGCRYKEQREEPR